MTTPIPISRAGARRFLINALALNGFQTLPDVPAALDRLELVQEDSINVCGRIHDLILRARVREYKPADLHQTLYSAPRQAFEYYFPNLCVLPIRDYPYFLPQMHARRITPGRWHGLLPDEEPIAQRLLEVIDSGGPLRTRLTGAADGHATSGWGTRTTVAARVVEKLYLHGRLSVSHRENFERYFDRTEKLLPEFVDQAHPDPAEQQVYLTRKRLRTRRFFRLKKADLEILGASAFAAVRLTDGLDTRPWHVLRQDLYSLQEAEAGNASGGTPAVCETVHLLAPLDPLVYDRERNRTLWDFDYIWEVYTPAAKRKWGYYVLPILCGDRLIGRLDPKIDRKTGVLTIHSLTFEPEVDPQICVDALSGSLVSFARFVGATRVDLPEFKSKRLRKRLEKGLI